MPRIYRDIRTNLCSKAFMTLCAHLFYIRHEYCPVQSESLILESSISTFENLRGIDAAQPVYANNECKLQPTRYHFSTRRDVPPAAFMFYEVDLGCCYVGSPVVIVADLRRAIAKLSARFAEEAGRACQVSCRSRKASSPIYTSRTRERLDTASSVMSGMTFALLK